MPSAYEHAIRIWHAHPRYLAALAQMHVLVAVGAMKSTEESSIERKIAALDLPLLRYLAAAEGETLDAIGSAAVAAMVSDMESSELRR